MQTNHRSRSGEMGWRRVNAARNDHVEKVTTVRDRVPTAPGTHKERQGPSEMAAEEPECNVGKYFQAQRKAA